MNQKHPSNAARQKPAVTIPTDEGGVKLDDSGIPVATGGSLMHLVEKLRGQGLVLRSNHLPLSGIGYDLTVWREPLQYGRDRRTAVARRIEGRVDVNTTDVFTLMDSEVPLSLVLEDGRTLNFFVTNSKGRIAGADGGSL